MSQAAASTAWPRMGLGCASLTEPGADGERVARAVIERAWQRGIRLFDTAPLYGGGLAEERLGAALRGLPRGGYMLCTKTGVTRPYAQGPIPPGSSQRRAADVWDYSPQATRASIERSLARLHTTYLDLVHLHDVEGRESQCLSAYECLCAMRADGCVRGIGLGSNGIAAARLLMEQVALDALLIAGRYTLLDQSAAALFVLAGAAGVRVLAGGVLNSGVLAHGITPAATFDYAPLAPEIAERVRVLQDVCRRHEVPLAAAALRFALGHAQVSTILLGSRNVGELDELLDMAERPVPEAFWRELHEAGVPSAQGSP
jgi:D-threo-aldose 1-dehydrogenase